MTHPSNNIEAEIDEILWQVERDYIVVSPILLTNGEIRDKAKTALKKLVSQATAQAERRGRKDELRLAERADKYDGCIATHIMDRLATLQSQSKSEHLPKPRQDVDTTEQ